MIFCVEFSRIVGIKLLEKIKQMYNFNSLILLVDIASSLFFQITLRKFTFQFNDPKFCFGLKLPKKWQSR